MDTDYLVSKLVRRVGEQHRAKMLAPVGLPFGVATVDGKNLATLDHDASGTGHKRSTKNEKWHLTKDLEEKRGTNYFLMPALRVVLSSAESKPAIYQLPLPSGKGEATVFSQLLDELQKAYGHGDLFRVIDGDAGLTSLANANLIVNAGHDVPLPFPATKPGV